jgi:hypothetical protein
MNAIYRYPGVKPFEATDSALFFGRERDLMDLVDIVSREKLTVLFGKSGYGKSSLVKAGLIPELGATPYISIDTETGEERATPNCTVYVRLNLFGRSNKPTMPCDAVGECFRQQVGADNLDPAIDQFFREKDISNTLWRIFKSYKVGNTQRIFLIFDQFEEFFSYPIDDQTQFRQELSELLYTRIPQSVRDQMADLDRTSKSAIHQQLDIHTLFIIRSDRIHLLNSMREELPAILHTRYELNALNEQQAKDAIVKPARLKSDSFVLQTPFEYQPDALTKILSELSKPSGSPYDQEEQRSIEAFQLQMVCQTIEQKLINQTREAKGNQPTQVLESDLPDFGQIYEQYYLDKLAGLPDADSRKTAHVMLEEVMVIGEEMADIRRVSMDKDLLEETMQRNFKLPVNQALLDYLEDKFMIRRETIGGRIHYEISHDVLLPPILKSREEARQQSARAIAAAEAKAQQEAAEKRAKEAEIMAQTEKEKREIAEIRRNQSRWLAAAAVAGFIIALLLGFWALVEKINADKAKIKAEQILAQLEETEKEKAKQEFYTKIVDMEIILKSPDGCPDKAQKRLLDSLPARYPEDQVLQKRVNNLKTLIHKNNCQ